MVGMRGHLLEVGGVIDDVNETVGNGLVGVVHCNPASAVIDVPAQERCRGRLAGGNGIHAQVAEGGAGGALDLAQARYLAGARCSDHRPSLSALGAAGCCGGRASYRRAAIDRRRDQGTPGRSPRSSNDFPSNLNYTRKYADYNFQHSKFSCE